MSAELGALLAGNHPADFWRVRPEPPSETWEEAIAEALWPHPRWRYIYAREGWPGLALQVLGEAQFGANRYRLSLPKRAYYLLKPLLPRRLVQIVRRGYTRRQEEAFPLGWPLEDRYVLFLQAVLESVLRRHPDSSPAPFWPDGAAASLVLTHDVEDSAGLGFVRDLADLDERYGFRASFNFVPERYPLDHRLMGELRERGFEVGVHGLNHDGKLFSSKGSFERCARRINRYLQEWGAGGFRAPLTHRHPEWMQNLEVEYDASFFDTDPYEPLAGGTMTAWPFFMGRFVELPYTLPQDHTLLITLGERSPRLWLEKLDAICGWGGMALLNSHPDYLREGNRAAVYEEFLRACSQREDLWNSLPLEVARWWRRRAGRTSTPVGVAEPAGAS